VACQAERSQVRRREKAIKMLKAKLYERALEDRKAALDSKAIAKKKIEWGSQIRSYVLQPYTLVKDHRTDFEPSNVNAVLDGDIEDFIEAYLRSGSTVPLASSVVPE
jgi:peptide chain release factor 2